MNVRLKPTVDEQDEIRLVLPQGRHLEEGRWYVAADIRNSGKRMIVVRIWSPGSGGYRVIVLDDKGGEHGSVRAPTYEEACSRLGVVGSAEHAHAEGRRLVSAGDPDWEIAAEIRFVGNEEIMFIRIWLQAKQGFSVYAIDTRGVVRGHTVAATYKRATETIQKHLSA